MECSITGCITKLIHARGLCNKHYRREQRLGKFRWVAPICKVCPLRARNRGYCVKHWSNIKVHGRILTQEEIRQTRQRGRVLSSGNKGHFWSMDKRIEKSKKTKGITLNTGRTHFRKGAKAWNTGLEGWISDTHKEAIARANKGRPAWNKGKKVPQVTKEKNPAWKGGVKTENELQRVKFKKYTQRLVLRRDNYTCQVCSQIGGFLHVDHIKSWSAHPDLRFEMDNCRTLCVPCHYYVTFKRKMPEYSKWGMINISTVVTKG